MELEFNFKLSRSERITLLRGLWDQQYKINSVSNVKRFKQTPLNRNQFF
jgi:hypothetical protein